MYDPRVTPYHEPRMLRGLESKKAYFPELRPARMRSWKLLSIPLFSSL
jgi:hypothetical protein